MKIWNKGSCVDQTMCYLLISLSEERIAENRVTMADVLVGVCTPSQNSNQHFLLRWVSHRWLINSWWDEDRTTIDWKNDWMNFMTNQRSDGNLIDRFYYLTEDEENALNPHSISISAMWYIQINDKPMWVTLHLTVTARGRHYLLRRMMLFWPR